MNLSTSPVGQFRSDESTTTLDVGAGPAMLRSLTSTQNAETSVAAAAHRSDFLARAAGDVGNAITVPDCRRWDRLRLNHRLTRRA
jgi:hypothetical protein